MPSIPKPVLICTIYCRGNSSQGWSNVSYWSPASSYDASNINDAAQDFFNVFAPNYAACIHSSALVQGVKATFLVGSSEFNGIGGSNTAGTQGGLAVSDQNAVVLRKLTGLAGRAKRGRFFVSGMGSLQFDGSNPDELNPASLGDYQTLAAAYGTDQTLGGILCHSRHWDRKNNVLVPIVELKVSSRVGGREDRRRHAPNVAL